MFDVANFTPTDTTFCHLKSPVDEEPIFTGTGDSKQAVGITFHAPGSEAYEAAETRRTNRSLMRGKKKIEVTADILRNDSVTFLTDITASFDNLGYSAAGEAKGSELYKALYSDRKFRWVVEQATVHLADLGNSMPKSATS